MSRPVRPLLPYAEAALVGLSLATVAGFSRLFSSGTWLPQLAAAAIAAHLVAIVTRRLRWSVPASAAMSIVVLAVTVGIVLYPSTTVAGIPTADTWSAVRTDFGSIWDAFQSVQAPTPVSPPFLLVATLALWWAAFVADWAAFRLWIPFEAVVPAGTVFVFSSLFAAHRGQVFATALFVLAAFGFILVHRVARQQSSAGWVSTDVQRGTNALLRTGAVLAVLAVVAAVVVGPHLPDAHSEALVGWRGNGDEGGGSRTTVSPLVQIKDRLVNQSNEELFVVQSSQRAYWRLTALDEFDGDIWSSNGSYEKASGSLPKAIGPKVDAAIFPQTYTVESLSTIWLPAAYAPKSIDAGGTNVRYAADTSTLIVGVNAPTSDHTTYTVQSEVPLFSADALAATTLAPPSDIQAHDLQLPPDFSQAVRDEATRVVQGKTTEYDKALALQSYFRDNFTYDQDVNLGESSKAMETFLFDKRAGYCEQFAGTYAAMARSLGMPARVAVGFTPGDEDANNPGVYHVRGLHAHAWPEVYFAGQGWVPFEPTPGRGAPHAEQYTGVTESQAVAPGVNETSTTAATPSTAATATTTPTNKNEKDQSNQSPQPPSNSNRDDWWEPSTTTGKGLLLLAAIVVAGLLYAVVVPLVRGHARRRRRREAVTPEARVGVAWTEATESAAMLGVPARASETAAEFAWRARETLGIEAYPELGALQESAAYSAGGASDGEAARAVALADEIGRTAMSRVSGPERLRFVLDPRPVERRGQARRHRRGTGSGRQGPAIEIVDLPVGSTR